MAGGWSSYGNLDGLSAEKTPNEDMVAPERLVRKTKGGARYRAYAALTVGKTSHWLSGAGAHTLRQKVLSSSCRIWAYWESLRCSCHAARCYWLYLNAYGRNLLKKLAESWAGMNDAMTGLLLDD